MVRDAALMPVRIDQTPVRMQLDSGAQNTLVTPDAMRKLRLELDHRRRTTLRGAGGVVLSRQNALIDNIRIDNADMLLGMDYFSIRHVRLSYATAQIFVETPPPTPPAP